jgi:hypothetical protein
VSTRQPRPVERVDARRDDRRFFAALFLCLAAALLNAFRIDKHFSADGVHYFAAVLENGDFFRVDGARRFAEFLTQWPLVLAVRAGLTHVPTLSAVFALGLFLPSVLSFAASVYAVRGENSALLALPILALAAVSLPADYLLVGEHHVMVALTSPILLLILRRAPPTWWDGGLLGLALLAFSRSYPTSVVPAALFAVLLALRLPRPHAFAAEVAEPAGRRAVFVRGGALLLCLVTIAFGVVAVIDPRDPANRDSFRLALTIPYHYPAVAGLAGAALLTLSAFALPWRLAQRACGIGAAAALVYGARSAWSVADGLTAHQSFSTRTLSLTLLPPLLLLAVAAHRRAPRLETAQRFLLAAVVCVAVLGNFLQASHWNHFRGEMKALLTTRHGFVPVETTTLYAHPCRWGWTSPSLSVVWSYPTVRAIIENRRGEPWTPFDPKRTLILKRYLRYDAAFSASESVAVARPELR